MSVEIKDLIELFKGQTGGAINALRAVVERHGCINDEAHHFVADAVNISQSEVRGIKSSSWQAGLTLAGVVRQKSSNLTTHPQRVI